MGLFGNKKVAEENEFEGATEWFKAQAKTAETFNNEDKDMVEQDTPKQARIFIAIEDNEKEGMVAASVKANDKKILIDALFKIAQHEDVQALISETQQAYQEAVQSDALLQEALSDLKDAYENSTGS